MDLKSGRSLHSALLTAVRRAVANDVVSARGMQDSEILGGFESLGDTCEFAGLQRAHGVDLTAFFNWSSTSVPMLLATLADDLAGADDLQNLELEIHQANPKFAAEYMIHHRLYGTHIHTFVLVGGMEPAKVLQREHRRLVMLRRKFLQDLRTGRRIYVFRSLHPVDPDEVETLCQVLRRKGPNRLLWVRLADADHPAGSVVQHGAGLIVAHIDALAPYEDGMACKSVLWMEILRKAYDLDQHGGARPLTSYPPPRQVAQA